MKLRRFGIYFFLIAVLVVLSAVWLCADLGRFLVVDRPVSSDVILVLNGDVNDRRLWRGVGLLRAGYGNRVLLDENTNVVQFGLSEAEAAEGFVKSNPELSGVFVCSGVMASTVDEAAEAEKCLKPLRPRSVLLVTSDFHTRRALEIFRHRLPQYAWSVAAARDPAWFGILWWQKRAWMKTLLLESQKLLWWEAVDRRRYGPIGGGIFLAAWRADLS